jgi:tryptophan-rich sensory protein
MRRRSELIGLVGWVALTFVAAAAGALASARAGTFYGQLERPAWAPPSWLFSPVWTALYLLMAVAAWLVWRERGFRGARTALLLYIAQLVANALWTWLFFAWRQGGAAFGEILLLWVLILATTISFWRIRRPAAALLLPYLAWVTFAAALTLAAWRMNPEMLG